MAYGGPEIGILAATGQLRRAIYGFVSLDSIPLEPHFRVARQTGTIEVIEYDEGAFYLGLLAAAHRVPFYPTRAGLGSDMLTMNPALRTVRSPYPGPDGADGEELVAIPAFEIDLALIHMNRADAGGNGQFLGPDLFFDDLFAMAGRPHRHELREGHPHRVVPRRGHLPHGADPADLRRWRRRGPPRCPLHRVPARLRPRRSRSRRPMPRQRRTPTTGTPSAAPTSKLPSHEAYLAAVDARTTGGQS